jgi:hypothetical protein
MLIEMGVGMVPSFLVRCREDQPQGLLVGCAKTIVWQAVVNVEYPKRSRLQTA